MRQINVRQFKSIYDTYEPLVWGMDVYNIFHSYWSAFRESCTHESNR